jgi:23S rRNA (uracil1939-C5)-methyltransferase
MLGKKLQGNSVELEIEKIASGGSGVGKYEGRAVFVAGTCPGDRITARMVEDNDSWNKAEVVELLQPGKDRIEAECPWYGTCGGCTLQQLSYEGQLEAKKMLVSDALMRIGGIPDARIGEPVHSSPYGYRNRMQFHRVNKPGKNEASIGLKKRSDSQVLPLDCCPVADPGIQDAMLRRKLSAPPWTDRFHVFSHGNAFLVEGGRTERGRILIRDRELNLDVRNFFQSNVAVLEILIEDVMRFAMEAPGDGCALDLYCGVGTFGAFLSTHFSRLDLVESERESVALARENVHGPGIRHFAWTDDVWVRRAESREEPYAFILVDPPRTGLSAALRQGLSERKPGLLAYVSCDPATLARDTKDLIRGGYILESCTPYDFYPQTAHIESLALFRSGN